MHGDACRRRPWARSARTAAGGGLSDLALRQSEGSERVAQATQWVVRRARDGGLHVSPVAAPHLCLTAPPLGVIDGKRLMRRSGNRAGVD